MANKKYKLTDGNYWATDGIHDFGQNKTQREINAALVQADSDLSGAIKGVANKHKYVFISDSYGVGITAGGTTDGLAVLIQQGLGLTSSEFYQNCVGGSGFIGTVTDTFITQLASVAASIPDANKPEITDVIFCGGYNDRMQTASALNTAIQTAATNARTFFPNAKLWIVMAGLLITSFLYPIRAINRAADYCYLLLLPLICNLNHEKQLPKDAVIAELIAYPMLLAVQFSL